MNDKVYAAEDLCIKHGGYSRNRCQRCADDAKKYEAEAKARDTLANLPMPKLEEKGMKFDAGKIDWSLLPIEPTEEVIKVLMFGEKKYARDNWKQVDKWEFRYYAAALRHMAAWQKGEKVDPETGLSHLAHAGCCVLFLLAKEIETNGTTQR